MTPALWKFSTRPLLRPVLSPKAGIIMSMSRWAFPMRKNIACISDSVAAMTARGKEAMIDCEHFFDGYKAKSRFMRWLAPKRRIEAGARWVVLCDTNGGTMPDEVFDIVSDVTKQIGGDRLGIHTHNDTEKCGGQFAGRDKMPECGKCRARLTG